MNKKNSFDDGITKINNSVLILPAKNHIQNSNGFLRPYKN